MRRIALFEFLDDYEISGKVMSGIGIDNLMPEKDVAGEKVGSDRLGYSSTLKNLGATFLFLTIVFAILIILVIGLVFICKRIKLSDANKRRLADIQKAVFFNALIRYSLVNALKLNMIAMLGIS